MIYPKIRDLREDRDLTQKQVANFLSVNQRTYSRYELGEIRISLETANQLANLYNTSVDYLMGRTNCREPYPKIRKK